MFSLSWLRQRGLTRARPSGRRRAAKAVALGCLVFATMLQTGCRSSGFGSGCGLFSACGFPARATSKIMQPFRRIGTGFAGAGDCGVGCGDAVYGAPIEYAGPVGVAAPVPLGTPTTTLPGSPVDSSVAPPSGAETELDPIPPSARPDAAPTRSPSIRRPQNSSYDAKRPVQNPGVNLTSAQARNRVSDREASSALDDIGPLELPPEMAEGKDSPPVAPAALKTPTTAPAPTPTPAAPTSTPSAASASAAPTAPDDHLGGRSDGRAEETLVAAVAPPAPPAATTPEPTDDAPPDGALGVARFHVVDPKLAAGSVPSTVGLGWLAEKGYRTVLDLRDSSKIDPTFMGEAAKRGLRYISFPTDLARLDKEHLDRFSTELALDAARPLYFFDEDGRVAGALWYIRRVLTDKSAFDVARREAEQIGLIDADSWKLARDYVDARTGATPAEPIKPAAEPAAAPAPRPPAQAQAPVVDRRMALIPVVPPITIPTARAFANYAGSPDVWQPLAAMLLTGLTFRVAFIGRGVIPTFLSKSRASLPAPAPRS